MTTPLPTIPVSATMAPALVANPRPSMATTARGALAGGVAAVAGALATFAVAEIGSPVRVITGWAPDGTDLGVPDVVVTTVISVVIAAIGLAILERRATSGLRTWTIAVAAVTVVSFVPLWRLDIDTGSKVALTIMHLVVGTATVAGQLAVRRSAH